MSVSVCADFFSAILTDYWFHCASHQWANIAAKNGQAAWYYHYQHVFSDASVFTRFGLPAVCGNRTCHATELPMAFQFSDNPASAAANITVTPPEVALENNFETYWR